MRPVEFETQEIVEAGHRIEADGKRVTGYALRRLLGGGDQKRLLSVWQSHQSQGRNEQQTTADLPIELEETLDKICKALSAQIRSMSINLNEVAVKSATRQVADITREYNELKEQNEAELKDATTIIEELERKNLELENALQVANQSREKALERAEKEREKAISMEARMNEMAGIEDIMNWLRTLEENPKRK